MKMLDREEYSPTSVVRAKIEESLSSQFDSSSSPTTCTTAKKKKYKKKKRFSDEQIKSLETMFESETKLDPRMKLQLAKELCLQPRQVAIWFQNRRARWKSKQLERDYSILRANYDDLASKYESLKNDNQSLIIQLQKLNDLLGKPRAEAASSWSGLGLAGNSTDGDSDNGDTKYETETTKPTGQLLDGLDLRVAAACSDDENSKHLEYFGQEDEAELMNIGEPAAYEMLASQEDWCSYDSSTDLFDHSCNSSSQWWEIWP